MDQVTRRDFHRLAMAAFGGVMAGSVAGCGGGNETAPAKSPTTATPPAGGTSEKPDGANDDVLAASVAAVAVERHVCRGLNACKNQGAGGENECAGRGNCATVEHHTCGGSNAC